MPLMLPLNDTVRVRSMSESTASEPDGAMQVRSESCFSILIELLSLNNRF